MHTEATKNCDVCGAVVKEGTGDQVFYVSDRRWPNYYDHVAPGPQVSGGFFVCRACWDGIPCVEGGEMRWMQRQVRAAIVANRIIPPPKRKKKAKK